MYLSLAIANMKLYILEPYPRFHSVQKKYLAWSKLACMLRLRCLPPAPRSAASTKLSPLYFPVRPISRAERCKSCPVALVPTLGCSRPLPPSLLLLASALSENMIPGYVLCSCKNNPYIRTRLVTPQEKNNHTGSTTPTDLRFRSCLDERPPARRESAGRFTIVCTHVHTPTSRSGAETAQGGAPPNPTLIRSTCVLLLLLLLYVAATAAAVLLLLLRLVLVRAVAATAAVMLLRLVD